MQGKLTPGVVWLPPLNDRDRIEHKYRVGYRVVEGSQHDAEAKWFLHGMAFITLENLKRGYILRPGQVDWRLEHGGDGRTLQGHIELSNLRPRRIDIWRGTITGTSIQRQIELRIHSLVMRNTRALEHQFAESGNNGRRTN